MNWYLAVLKNYAGFDGRARRMEYWMFQLFNVIIYVIAMILAGIISEKLFVSLLGLYALAIIIPSIAVCIRRLHDTGRSGWWILISFVPLVGGIILLIFTILEGDAGTNQYGPDPKEQPAPQ